MRRLFELTVMAATAVILVATSQARSPCPVETLNLRADSTCGPSANLVVSSTTGCSVSAPGAEFGGLPTAGYINEGSADAGLGAGFFLSGAVGTDGGMMICSALAADGGFNFRCTPNCFIETAGDAGENACGPSCEGTFTPQ